MRRHSDHHLKSYCTHTIHTYTLPFLILFFFFLSICSNNEKYHSVGQVYIIKLYSGKCKERQLVRWAKRTIPLWFSMWGKSSHKKFTRPIFYHDHKVYPIANWCNYTSSSSCSLNPLWHRKRPVKACKVSIFLSFFLFLCIRQLKVWGTVCENGGRKKAIEHIHMYASKPGRLVNT